MNTHTNDNNPVPGSVEWHRRLYEKDISDMMLFNGDEIMAEFHRKPDENGNWRKENFDFLEMVCRERLGPFNPG